MNYLAEIKAFYDSVQIKQLSTGQIALWHALMSINNKCAWVEWFTVANLTLELNTGMSRSGVLKARNSLKQNGFIDFKTNGTKATMYKMHTMLKSKQDSKQNSVQDGKQVSTQIGVQDSNTLNKLNETKRNYSTAVKAITKCYEENIGMMTPATAEKIFSYIPKMNYELVIEAIKISAVRNKRTTAYICGILNDWNRKNYKVLADIQEEQKKGKMPKEESHEEMIARKLKDLEGGLYDD